MDEIKVEPEHVELHQCRCLVMPQDRCHRLIPMDQPICIECEGAHFGEHRTQIGTLVPLGQP
jgi:hypothetical protein